MALNSLATATKYTAELDKMYVQKSVTGFLADNAFGAKFVGAKTVVMPDIDFVGLASYDRDEGFNKAKTTIGHKDFTITMDRGRSLQIDSMDMDETGVANLAGKVLGEFVRTKVVPECDAYVLSALYKVAADTTGGKTANVIEFKAESAYADLVTTINNVYNNAGYDEELVAFIDTKLWTTLMTSSEISRHIIVSDFKQGDISLKVKSLNGVALIPVSSNRMKTDFIFNTGKNEDGSNNTEQGGFSVNTAEGAKDVHAIILPKSGAHLVRKTEKMRIFTPEQNLDADAYKFDYRIFYDVFVKKSNGNKIFAIVGETAQ